MPTILVSLVLLAPPTGHDEGLARLEMKPVEIALPGGETRTAYRGMLRVPIVRANPDSKEIGIDVWRFSLRCHLWQSRRYSRACKGLSLFIEYVPKANS